MKFIENGMQRWYCLMTLFASFRYVNVSDELEDR